MRLKLTKLIAFLLIFLLCFNIHGLLSMFLKVDKVINITYQNESFLNTNSGSGSGILKVGITTTPVTLEPVDCWDSSSSDVIEQVVETLFTNNFSNLELPRINELAKTYWWEDTTTLQITLRQGIFFHDDTPFNASAAKWNLDRLLYLTNCSGTNTGEIAQTTVLWLLPDGVTPIIASVSAVGNWNITINLNGPYAPLLDLLCYINAGMVSPSSTPATEFIDLSTGQLIGTGPFKYDYYNPNIEIKFTRWDNYWKTPAFFEEMLFVIYSEAVSARNALLAYELDILRSVYTQDLQLYDADPGITVKRFTEDTGKSSFVYQYLGFNNQKYNKTWRKAMSFAINYTYILQVMKQGNCIRANSPIAPGFIAAFNASATAANYDIATARTAMQSMGFGVGYTTDAQWVAHAESTGGKNPFLSVPNTYNVGNSFREDMFVALSHWFKQIGIEVVDDGVTWNQFLYYLLDDHDHLGVFTIGWGPDYLEPYNMLDPLFNPISGSNSGQVNDAYLNAQMALAVSTSNYTARNNIYKNIQWYMAEVGYFHAPIYHNKLNFVHLSEIKGVQYNAMDKFYAYPMYSLTPGPLTLSSDAEVPDPDGNFTLNWTESLGAENYAVYRHSSYINSINGTLTVLTSGIAQTSLTINDLFSGTHYFIVEALNASGYTLSNCIEVVVQIPSPPGDQIISIIAPTTGQIFETSPIYEIAVQFLNLDTIWCTLDGGENNFTITLLRGIINQELWDDLPNGNVRIRFYANDTFGGVNYEEVIVVKNTPPPPPPPQDGISGYAPLYIIGAIFVSSYMLIRKRKKAN